MSKPYSGSGSGAVGATFTDGEGGTTAGRADDGTVAGRVDGGGDAAGWLSEGGDEVVDGGGKGGGACGRLGET